MVAIMSSSILKVISVTALICGVVSNAQAALLASAGFGDCLMAADSELDQMRGGFATSSNGVPLSFSFGIENATFVNGQLVSTTTVAIPMFSSVNTPAGAAAFNSVNVIQNGTGNVFSVQMAQNAPASVLTVIQNNLDNQKIGNATIINATVTSKSFLNSLAVQSTLNQMLFKSLH